MSCFESMQFEYEKQPGDGAEFVNAAAKQSTVGLHEDMPANSGDATCQLAHFRMEKRLGAANPHNGRGTSAHTVQ